MDEQTGMNALKAEIEMLVEENDRLRAQIEKGWANSEADIQRAWRRGMNIGLASAEMDKVAR